MKKSICLLSLVLLALSSCSRESPKQPKPEPRFKLPDVKPEDLVLDEKSAVPKTIIYSNLPYGIVDDRDNTTYTIDFVYEGNKIKSLTYKYEPPKPLATSKKVFTYKENKISEVQAYYGYGKEESKGATTVFTYGSDNKLQSWYVIDAFNKGAKYTYNADGTILVVYYNYTDNLPVDETKGTKSKLIPSVTYTPDARGNITKIVNNDKIVDGNYYISDYTCTYDEKNNPFKNVLGYQLLLDNADIFIKELEEKSPFNNPVNLVINKKSVTSGYAPAVITTTYENAYDKNNIFLVKMVSKINNSKAQKIINIAYGSIN